MIALTDHTIDLRGAHMTLLYESHLNSHVQLGRSLIVVPRWGKIVTNLCFAKTTRIENRCAMAAGLWEFHETDGAAVVVFGD